MDFDCYCQTHDRVLADAKAMAMAQSGCSSADIQAKIDEGFSKK